MAKLKRKELLAWIRNLSNGRYRKAKATLVSPKLNGFCCLGVWADMHGCTFEEYLIGGQHDGWVPVLPGRAHPEKVQESDTGGLSGKAAFGLSEEHQQQLSQLNDHSGSWKPVIRYIKEELLPSAK